MAPRELGAMPQKLSRREFAARAAATAGAAGLAAAGLGQAAKPSSPKANGELDELEALLEKPLPTRLRAPAAAALKTVRNNAKERLKFKLPEGSEPCTTFIPLPPRSGS